MHRVAVLALPGVVAFELAIPCQVFASARSARPLYEVLVCAERRRVAAMASFDTVFEVVAPYGLDTVASADTVIVPASLAETPSPAVLAALRAARARGARIASICTGAYVLASAGLLDGLRATTHWAHCERLAALHPSVSVDPAVLFVDEGHVLTAAGLAAGLDLCLHLVRRDHGAAEAAYVARRIVMPPHRDGGQAQYLTYADAGTSADGSLEPTLTWLRTRLGEEVSLAEIAQHAMVSPRTLLRRFRSETGTTPLRWLIHQRLDRARQLLETTDLTVDEVAKASGLTTALSLRQHFARHLATTPTQYRRTFQSTGS
ncbi:GlxA family transcriptional regulator [Tenggerimyces flavus]|uniref:GlxA family transcriptional regulator n=1 Tax=Tenggerimyces flavus TaxID=1708749 RepID=A0ABV7YEX4_9ACTN|nr:helix-turn-helix domain-containing protein [Tenggerimyces flavus]MBM7787110.1 transcriptional regulator GlxA family with amidase domain [Tenggerimyces flavus]